MSEIEKMYENAGIKPIAEYCKHQCNNEFDDDACIGCKHIEKVEYPPFTAEKQLNIVKMILFSTWWINLKRLQFSEKFDEGLAQMINELWRDLSDEEQQQVKGILE